MNMAVDRRTFLGKAAAAGVGLSLSGGLRSRAQSPGPISGANNRLRVAVIGTNSRGLAHVEGLLGLPQVEIAYICDVDERAVAKGIKEALKAQ